MKQHICLNFIKETTKHILFLFFQNIRFCSICLFMWTFVLLCLFHFFNHLFLGTLWANNILSILIKIYYIFLKMLSKTVTWMNPLPTIESLQMLQKKHSLCQAKVSKATNLVLPRPPLPKSTSIEMFLFPYII